MGHEITSKDDASYREQGAWHGKGSIHEAGKRPNELLDSTSIDPTVDSAPLYIRRTAIVADADGNLTEEVTYQPVENHKATVRPSTGEVYGVVGKDYVPTDPRTVCDLGEAACDQLGDVAEVESLFSMKGQRVFALLLRLGESFAVHGEKDEHHPFGLLTTAHDGTQALACIPTVTRVVCWNTYSWALGAAEKAGAVVRLRHTANVMDRVPDVVRALTIGQRQLATMAQEARDLAAHRMTDEEVRSFFATLYVKTYGQIPAKPSTKGERAKFTRAQEMIANWSSTLDRERNSLGLSDPTAYLVANAVTEWSDHKRSVRGRNGQPADRNFSNLLGTGAAFKRQVYAAARDVAGLAKA